MTLSRPSVDGIQHTPLCYPMQAEQVGGVKVQIHPNGDGFVSRIELIVCLSSFTGVPTCVTFWTRLTNHFRQFDAC